MSTILSYYILVTGVPIKDASSSTFISGVILTHVPSKKRPFYQNDLPFFKKIHKKKTLTAPGGKPPAIPLYDEGTGNTFVCCLYMNQNLNRIFMSFFTAPARRSNPSAACSGPSTELMIQERSMPASVISLAASSRSSLS